MSTIKTISFAQLPDKEQPCRNNQNRYSQVEDTVLWNKLRGGDESAFTYVYSTYFEELSHFGIQFAQLQVVEDCIQDMFIDLRRKRNKLPPIHKSIRLFLFQSIKHRILNVLKSNKNEFKEKFKEHQFEIIPSYEELLILNQHQKDKLKRLDLAIDALDKRHREVIYYFFYKGMGYEEIRKLMAFHNVKSVRNIVYKIVGTLKKSF